MSLRHSYSKGEGVPLPQFALWSLECKGRKSQSTIVKNPQPKPGFLERVEGSHVLDGEDCNQLDRATLVAVVETNRGPRVPPTRRRLSTGRCLPPANFLAPAHRRHAPERAISSASTQFELRVVIRMTLDPCRYVNVLQLGRARREADETGRLLATHRGAIQVLQDLVVV